MRTELKALKEKNIFQVTFIKDLNTNLESVWEEFKKIKQQLSSILEEQQSVRRDVENVQNHWRNLGKEIDNLYEKGEQEENLFPPTKKGDGSIINNSQQVKEEDKPNNQKPEYQDPRLISKLIYHDGESLSYSEKQALKKLPGVVNLPRFTGVVAYDHIELIYYIDGLFVDFPKIPDYWTTEILNNSFKRHASIWYTEMKEIHGRKSWPWWRN
ncbi:hypothetical protein O181_010227 [Austropuccinia psidii MF-1]|uniref:Uncharacterized protein n=1 Tax=Austropuccinia psidii MF-1 TaxID=1389203 RepID=A0A9Q3BS69_9BASI|nr:hypothetical protein [Austropuccinia psidii MF-1]